MKFMFRIFVFVLMAVAFAAAHDSIVFNGIVQDDSFESGEKLNVEKAIELAPGKMNSLPFAYKLDDAPYFEKFFFVTSPKEFAVEENDIDKLLKRSDVKVVGFTLKKAGK